MYKVNVSEFAMEAGQQAVARCAEIRSWFCFFTLQVISVDLPCL